MIFLKNDYSDGVHPRIIEALSRTNLEKQLGYGEDEYTIKACNIIKDKIKKEDADIHLLVGGTQTNKVVISAFLRPIDAIIATDLSHIEVHEAGAIESAGHKIINVKSIDGKLTVKAIDFIVKSHANDFHSVRPKLVYISNSTELGTIYKKDELIQISECCKKNNLYLYIDGARLINALTCDNCDITLSEIADLCDAFYIGGTKNGAMLGEALVILNNELKQNMKWYIKQNGALLAKSRFLGIQFEELLKDDLIFELSKNSNKMAKLLSTELEKLGFEFVANPETNMVFTNISKELNNKLLKHCHYIFKYLENTDDVEARFVTSYTTTEEEIREFIKKVKEQIGED